MMYVELKDNDAIRVERMLRGIEAFRSIDMAMPASYMAAFLLVALKPGLGSTEYAKFLGIAQAAASRILLEIGQKSRHGRDGYDLVISDTDPHDLRQKRMRLTDKGEALLARIIRAQGITI